MLLVRSLPQKIVSFTSIMSRRLYVDATLPPYTGPRDILNNNAFHKTVSVLGARISPDRTRVLLKADELKKYDWHVFNSTIYRL